MSSWRHFITRLEGAYAPSTIRCYEADFAGFASWCRKKRKSCLPATPETLGAYIDAVAPDLKPASLKRRIAAVRKLHRLAGHPDVAGDETVVLALRRATRAQPGRPGQALGLIAKKRDALVAATSDDLTGLRDRLLVSVGFDTLCRRSELVALRVEDFTFESDGSCAVLVRRAKNDPDGLGRIAHLSAQSREVLQDWLARTGITKGPLLRPVYGRHVPSRYLSAFTVSRLLKKLAVRAGFAADEVARTSGHSLRVGAAQELTLRGFGLLPIMAAGGWRSMSVVGRYVEHVDQNVWQPRG